MSQSLLLGERALPTDFPFAEFMSAELEFRARVGTSPIDPSEKWAEFGPAWIAVAYRFLDVTYFDEQFRDSITRFGPAPEQLERYRQERHLFGFFVSGLSAIESLCYGLCVIAWEANPKRVSLASPGEKKGVSPESTLDRMRAHFPAAEITSQLQTTLASPEYRGWVAMRNALAHRTSPPRKHYLHLGSAASTQPPSEWGNLTLDDKVTEQRSRSSDLATPASGSGPPWRRRRRVSTTPRHPACEGCTSAGFLQRRPSDPGLQTASSALVLCDPIPPAQAVKILARIDG